MSIRAGLLSITTAAAVFAFSPADAQIASRGSAERDTRCAYGAIAGAIGGYTLFTTAVAAVIGPPTVPAALAATAIGGLVGCTVVVGFYDSLQSSVGGMPGR